MSAPASSRDAKASVAFDRYARACAKLRETQSPSDLVAARRACKRFLTAFLSRKERRQVEEAISERGRQ